jgi:hypothetical protein
MPLPRLRQGHGCSPTAWHCACCARPHVLLVIFLMAMLAVFPLIERSGVGRSIVNLLMVTSIVVALYRVRVRRSGVLIVAVLGALAVTGQILHEAKIPGPAGVVSAGSQMLFYAIAAGMMCIYMLGDTRATIDELFAAAAAYMLLSLAWAPVSGASNMRILGLS